MCVQLIYCTANTPTNLHIVNAVHQAHQSSQNKGLDNVVGDVTSSVQDFADALLARVRTDSASLGLGPALLGEGLRLKATFQDLVRDAVETGAGKDPASAKRLTQALSGLLRTTDEVLESLEQDEFRYLSSSREIRRSQMRKRALTKKLEEVVKEIRETLVGFLEVIDPTPDDHFDNEVRRIHGDRSDSMIRSFREFSVSDHGTLKAFKQRRNLN